VLLLEIYDRVRMAWLALLDRLDPVLPAAREKPSPQPRRRAF
jgi:hypothetical protein